MKIRDFIIDHHRKDVPPPPHGEALVGENAFQEAALLNILADTIFSEARLLLDFRGALQSELGNTSVTIIRSMQSLRWSGNPLGPRTWYPILGSRLTVIQGTVTLTLDGVDGSLEVVGRTAELYAGDVPGCDAAPPDFTYATDSEVRAGLASWSSEFSPNYASFVNLW